MAITKRRSQVVSSPAEIAAAAADVYRAEIARLESQEQDAATVARLALARKLLAICER